MATLEQVVSYIKHLKIQGAQTIAEVALQAWADAKDKKLASRLLKEARPTEPMLFNAISAAEAGHDPEVLICKFKNDKEKIFKCGAALIKNKSEKSLRFTTPRRGLCFKEGLLRASWQKLE